MREKEQSLIAGLRAMNEPVLNTLRPLEEIDHEEEDDNAGDKKDQKKDDSSIINEPNNIVIPESSPIANKKKPGTNFLTEKTSITKTFSMESYNIDPNEIKNADDISPPGSAANFKRADSLASAKLAAVVALTSKLNYKERDSVFMNEAPKIEMQKSLEDTFGQSSINNVKDWWLTCVDDRNSDEDC